MASADVVGTLRTRSVERLSGSSDFAELQRKIELYNRQKNEKFLSINREKFKEVRKELDAQKEEEKKLIETQKTQDKVFVDSFYNQEVLNIAADYLDALQQQDLAKAG
jgi:carboxyl-terminal processing protease